MIKVFMHTYVRGDGKRVPTMIAPTREAMGRLADDDRVMEVWLLTGEEYKALQDGAWDAAVGDLKTWCRQVLVGEKDVLRGEVSSAFDALEFLKSGGMAGQKAGL